MELQAKPFQLDGEQFLASRKSALLADEMGLGKTMQSILATRHFEGPVLVVCRPLNKPFWAQEIRQWDDNKNVPIRFAVVGGHYDSDEVQRWFTFPRKRGYLLIHHEALWRVAGDLRKHGIWETIIVDEAHRIKNHKAQTTAALKWIPTYHKYALTGTITEKNAADLWSLLNWFDKRLFKSYHVFYNHFVDFETEYFGGRKIHGSKNQEELAALIAPYFLRRIRNNVGLPNAATPEQIPVKMSDEQQKFYNQIEKETFIDLDNGEGEFLFIGSALSRLNRLKFAALDPALIGSAVRGTKIDWLVDWQKDHNEQYVVFTESRQFAVALPVLLPNGAAIASSVAQKKRDEHLAAFNKGDLRYIVGTIGAMSESVNMDAAHICVFTDLVWSSIAMPQAEMRVQRLVSKESAQIFHLLSVNSVDYLYAEGLDGKYTDRKLIERFLEKYRTNGTVEN